jgi:hypothetical protein
MTKQTTLFFILFGLLSSSIIMNVQAETERLSLTKIKSPIEIFQQHIQKVDEMNPDNGQAVKRLLQLCFEATHIQVTEYLKLISKNKYNFSTCRNKASAKRITFCITHRMHEFSQSLSQHDNSIIAHIFENLITKYADQHSILHDQTTKYLCNFLSN